MMANRYFDELAALDLLPEGVVIENGIVVCRTPMGTMEVPRMTEEQWVTILR